MFKFKYVVLAAALLLLCSVDLLATAQAPDRLIYNGKEYRLHSNPMEAFFREHPNKKPKGGIMSSALWRGYVATFEITAQQLYLKDVMIEVNKATAGDPYETVWKSALSTVVPDGKKLKIDWFSGLLVVPYGEQINYVHMGYASTYKNYILIEIDKGDFKRSKEFDYKKYAEFKEKQFAAFKLTPEYTQLVKRMKKENNDGQEFIDSFLKDFITTYTSKILVD